MNKIEIDYIGEGLSDLSACRRLICEAGGVPGVSYFRPVNGTGKQNLDSRLSGLNAGSVYGRPVLVLRDLDKDAGCAPSLIDNLIKARNVNFLFRVCVRELEVWLMADRKNFSNYLGCKIAEIPANPEDIDDPKNMILGLAASGSAKKLKSYLRDTRSRGVPDWAALGRWHSDFAEHHWDIRAAIESRNSPSLIRSFSALQSCVSRVAAVSV